MSSCTDCCSSCLVTFIFPIHFKGISPGFVRTEIRGRSQRVDDIEAAKKEYDTLTEVLHCVVYVLSHFSVKTTTITYPTLSSVVLQEVLEPEDIASLVIFALSCHPRIDVRTTSFCGPHHAIVLLLGTGLQ